MKLSLQREPGPNKGIAGTHSVHPYHSLDNFRNNRDSVCCLSHMAVCVVRHNKHLCVCVCVCAFAMIGYPHDMIPHKAASMYVLHTHTHTHTHTHKES